MSIERDLPEERALAELVNGRQVGEIAGVKFDLRHPALELDRWEATGPLMPFLWFPWRRAGEWPSWDREAGDVDVAEGDAVSIAKVECFGGPVTALDDPAGPLSRFAHFEVKRPNGAVYFAEGFEGYCPKDAMGPFSPHMDYGDEGEEDFVRPFMIKIGKISARIGRLEPCKRGRQDWSNFAKSAMELLTEELSEFESSEERWPWCGQVLADLAAAAGYALAMAETEQRLGPARHGLRATAAYERNRVRAVAKRRELGEPTRQKAREVMCRRPHLTLNACASAIADGRDQSGVRKVIAELFPEGPDGKRRYAANHPADRPG